MKLNNKGFLITGILYSLLLLFLVLIIGMVAILSARQKKLDYISHDIITRLNDKYDFNVAKVWDFDYTGNYQTFTAPTDGYYNIELWGAQGGSITGTGYTYDGTSRGNLTYNGGNGAYTKGTIYLNKGENIYIYVGGTPSQVNNSFGSSYTDAGGYNGGANLADGQGNFGAPGGGATDIRLKSGTWDDFDSLKSRIMVAAGGGGANFRNQGFGEGNGGAGGAFYGNNGQESLTEGSYFRPDYPDGYFIGTGATQISGGHQIQYHLDGTITVTNSNGGFGKSNIMAQSGGGAGYYCGGSNGHGGAGGGSSFVSGLYGCDAITQESTADAIVHTGQPNHYSGKVFSNGIMIAGSSDMPTHDGTGTMEGNTGNGYAKISLLSTSPKSYTMTNLIKNGSFEDGVNHFTRTEGIAITDNTNIYYGNNSLKLLTNDNTVPEVVVYYSDENDNIDVFHIKNKEKYYCSTMYLANQKAPQMLIYGTDYSLETRRFTSWGVISPSWKKLSVYIDYKDTDYDFWFRLDNDSMYTNNSIYFDGVICLNLTESFGAGNEPSKDWCDKNISYFDGTSTIYK